MNTIELVNTLPRVFAGQPGIQSEVWLKTLRFERGKKYLISAESGCGKSSLCAYLYGYRKDYEGTFLFDGRSIDELTVEEWCDVRRRHIAYLPQEMRLFPELTALENVELKNRLPDIRQLPRSAACSSGWGLPTAPTVRRENCR